MPDLSIEERGRVVSKVLREYMSKKRISGTQLAFKLGVRPQAVSNQLARGRLFSPSLAEQWVNAFSEMNYNLNPFFLITGEGPVEESWIPNNSKRNDSYTLKRTKYDLAILQEENKRLKNEINDLKKKLLAISKLSAMDK